MQKEIIRYKRDDGVDLTATLYLPPGYDPSVEGPLPCLFWAYPREYKSKVCAQLQLLVRKCLLCLSANARFACPQMPASLVHECSLCSSAKVNRDCFPGSLLNACFACPQNCMILNNDFFLSSFPFTHNAGLNVVREDRVEICFRSEDDGWVAVQC